VNVTNWDQAVGQLLSLENKTYHRLNTASVAAWEQPESLLLNGTTRDGRPIHLRVDVYRDNLVRLRVSLKPIQDKQTVMQAGELHCNCTVAIEDDEKPDRHQDGSVAFLHSTKSVATHHHGYRRQAYL
jgi:hypothetical protein